MVDAEVNVVMWLNGRLCGYVVRDECMDGSAKFVLRWWQL